MASLVPPPVMAGLVPAIHGFVRLGKSWMTALRRP